MMRSGVIAVMTLAAAAVILPAVLPPSPMLLWNTTASVPLGFYRLASPQPLTVGELVVARLPSDLARALAKGGYLPSGVPLIKPVAAMAGQMVCRAGLVIRVDGLDLAKARVRDRRDRPLPAWSGCLMLRRGQILLMNPAEPNSLDGRYFGALPIGVVVARALPLWTWGRP